MWPCPVVGNCKDRQICHLKWMEDVPQIMVSIVSLLLIGDFFVGARLLCFCVGAHLPGLPRLESSIDGNSRVHVGHFLFHQWGIDKTVWSRVGGGGM